MPGPAVKEHRLLVIYKAVGIYVTDGTIVGDVENYVSVVLSWIRLSVTF